MWRNKLLDVPDHSGLVTEFVLARAAPEIDDGDFTIAIILSAMAVETAVTQIFVKWKGIEAKKQNPTDAEIETWEGECAVRLRFPARYTGTARN